MTTTKLRTDHAQAIQGASEEQLVGMGRDGSTIAIGELFERYYSVSLNIARRILSSEAEAEDAVQSAYCSAFQHMDSFRGDASFKTWINRIVVNRCLAMLREPWRRFAKERAAYAAAGSLDNFAGPSMSPERIMWFGEVTAAHDRALSALAPGLRAAYSLYAVSELPVAQIAAELGVSVAAAKSRVFRARTALQQSLGPLWETRSEQAKTIEDIR